MNPKLYFIPANPSTIHHGFYVVANNKREALAVFQEQWEMDVSPKDLTPVTQQIALPNSRKKKPRILNTDAGLLGIDIVKYFDEPAFFGVAHKSDPYGIPEIALSEEAWAVYNDIEYEPRWRIAFQATDHESGLKIRVDDGGHVVWMYTYETDELYNEVHKPTTEEGIEFALSLLRGAVILRKKYQRMFEETMEETIKRAEERFYIGNEKVIPFALLKEKERLRHTR